MNHLLLAVCAVAGLAAISAISGVLLHINCWRRPVIAAVALIALCGAAFAVAEPLPERWRIVTLVLPQGEDRFRGGDSEATWPRDRCEAIAKAEFERLSKDERYVYVEVHCKPLFKRRPK